MCAERRIITGQVLHGGEGNTKNPVKPKNVQKAHPNTCTQRSRIRCFAFFCCARTVVLKSFLGKLVKSYLGSLKTLLDGVCVGEMPKTSCGGFLLGRMPKHEG